MRGGSSLVDQKQVTLTAKTDQATTESSAKTTTPAQSDDQTTAQAQTKTEDQASVDAKTDASDGAKTQLNADKQSATESKTDQASEDQAAKTNNDQATSAKKVAADDNASTTSKDQSTTTDQTAVKNEENNDIKANDAKTTNLSLTKGSVLKAQAAKASLVQTKAATNDENTITVNTAQELIDAIQKGTATTINIGKNIDLGEETSSQYTNTNIYNKRNIIIQSADGKHYTVDFNGYGFNMYSNDYGVTFKDLDLYGRSYFGIVRSAGSYTFDNVNYTGSQLIYTDSGYNTTVNFDGNVTAHSVGSYTSPLNNKSQTSQGGNTQQVIQFAAGTNTINFNSGSNVTLTTTNSNVLEVDRGTTTINVKNGAQVSLNPHTQNGPEQLNGMSMDSIARGIASNGDTTLNIDQGGNLDINLTKNTEDKYLSGALYLNSGATINVNGNLNINSDGTPYYRSQGWDDPVYINGNATINVNGGSFKANATNMGDYKGSVVTSNGNSTIAISHHGTFNVTGDGTQATGVSLGSGSTFTSTQPELFNISMPDGATAIKNGKVQFKGVKTSADGQPIGEIDITYASDGTPTVTKVTSYDEATTTATRTAGNNAKNKINLVAAGEEVNLSNVSFVKNADGTYTMSGNANTADNKGAYVYVSVNGTVHQVAPTDSQTLWTAGETGDPTSSQVPYTTETGADSKFTVNLGKLKDTDQVSVYAAKDFVASDTDTKTVSDWMTSSYRDQLQKLVDEAPTVEADANFTNAGTEQKEAYTTAISNGNTLLQNTSATSEQLQDTIKAINNAKNGLNGDLNSAKQALQDAVNEAPAIEKTAAYYNADSTKQTAYTDAITAGSDALKASNPTVKSLTDALTAINTAKSALNGQATNKAALETAVKNSDTVKASNNYTNADEAQKTAYDNAVTNAKSVLDNTDATQDQVDQALQKLEEANSKLNGDTKTDAANKAALEAAVNEAPTVRETPAFYNGTDEAQEAYNKAITDGQAVLDNTNATADQIKGALDAITTTKGNLKGEATNTDALNKAIATANDAKQTSDYTDADQAKQEALTNAITAGQSILTKPNATQAEVDNAVKTINDAISDLNGTTNLETAKTDATAAINNELKDKTTAINQAANIDQDQKTSLINEATQAANKAKDDIKNATTTSDVTTAKNTGIENINKVTVPSLDVAKQEATKAVDDALASQKELINQANNLSDTEKQSLINKATTAANTAKDNINKATTNVDVAKAGQDGVTEIGKVVPTSLADAKDAANKAIDDALTKKLNSIDAAQNLTTDEKTELTNKANTAANEAKDKVAQATTNDEAAQAGQVGADAIDAIPVPTESAVKQEAKDAVAKAADEKNQVIDASSLTAEEKAALKQEVTKAQDDANAAIDSAKTNEAVKTAQEAGVGNINKISVPADSAVKTAAKEAVAQEAAKKNQAIDASSLTDEEKAALKQKVTNAQNAADTAIDNAKTNTAVTNAKNTGISNIQNIEIPTKSTSKEKATADLTNAVDAAKAAIDQDTNLTEDERKAAKAQVDSDASAAQEAINKATSNDAVTSAATAGKVTIDKTVANAAIDNAAAGKNKEIANSPLTTDEQNKLRDQVANEVKTAKDNIAKATTDSAVATAQEKGVAAINGIKVPTNSTAKDQAKSNITDAADKAKQAIDDALNSKVNEINNASNLNDTEKKNLVDQATEAANTAKSNVENATTNADAQDAANKGIENIKGITFTSLDDAKKAANSAIDHALQVKTDEINNASNLSDQEKQDLINKATDAANTAKDNITKATTNDAVNDAQNKGIEEIANVAVPSLDQAKQDAINAIKQVQAAKNTQISDAKNLSADQQKSLTDQVDKIANDAIAKINDPATTTNDAVASTRDDAIKQITDLFIPTLDGAQNDATNAIETAKNAKIDEINNAQNLSDQEKQALTDQVNKAADDATKAIKDATTNDAVKNAETKGLNDINNIKVPSLAEKQQEAKDAVAKAAEAKNKVIDSSDLTGEEKAALKKQVSDAQTAANKAIDDASTDAGVTKAQNDGIDNINKITIPETSDAKAKATTDLKDAVDNAKKAIDQDANLTNDQKQAAKDAIDQDAKTAQEAINNANTDSDVKKATDNGQLAIDKDVANAAIDNAAAGKKAEIAKSPLTDAEKQALDQQVDQQVQTAKSNIAKATTTDEVTTAQNNGIDNINNIKIPSVPTTNLTDAKNAANTAIDNAAAAKKDAIKAAQDAGTITADQAADLNKQVDQVANEAKQAINNATTASQVEQAQNNGVQKINNINIPSITDAKDAAKDAIDQAAKNKDAEIDASNLSDQEKADLKNEVKVIADTAKKSIDSVDNAAEVNNAMNAGIAAINSIKVATSSDNQNGQSGNNGSTIDNGSGEATNNNGSQAGSVTGATTSQSNGAKVSATGLNGKNAVRINANKQAAQLPQTGNQTNTNLGAVGLAAASLAGLFGFTKLGKKKED